MAQPQPEPVEVLEGFLDLDAAGLAQFIADRELAMDEADLAFCQQYFQSEGRCPTITEIKMIDTYWSDHCRHTTFGTEIDRRCHRRPARAGRLRPVYGHAQRAGSPGQARLPDGHGHHRREVA